MRKDRITLLHIDRVRIVFEFHEEEFEPEFN